MIFFYRNYLYQKNQLYRFYKLQTKMHFFNILLAILFCAVVVRVYTATPVNKLESVEPMQTPALISVHVHCTDRTVRVSYEYLSSDDSDTGYTLTNVHNLPRILSVLRDTYGEYTMTFDLTCNGGIF